MIKLLLRCAMCGKQMEFEVDTEKTPPDMEVRTLIEKSVKPFAWVVQYNNPHLDIYCCKRCAQ